MPRIVIRKRSLSDKPQLPSYKINHEVKSQAELEQLRANQPERINWAQEILGIPDWWWQTQGEGVRVAVLDTGIDTSHPDLAPAIADTRDFSGEGIEDLDGHGTHCAGVIAARLNGVGFVGLAPKSELLVAKVLSEDGGAYEWISAGIDWAVDNGADVISMSLGGPGSTHGLYQAVQKALYHGVLVLCAAGNEGSLYQNSIGYPGRYGGVITIGSHDQNGNASGFSSRGGEVDFLGPGEDIWSTYKNGGYATLSGTSMATPFVAGLSTLMLAKHRKAEQSNTPLSNNEDLRNHLMRMANHPGYYDNRSGYGPLQPFRNLMVQA